MKAFAFFILILICVSSSAQQWEDKTFKSPEDLDVGLLDSVFVFKPQGLRLVNVYANGSRVMGRELKRGDLLVARMKFDSRERLESHQQFSFGSYSAVSDRFLGFHTVTYEYEYPNPREYVVNYSDTRELTKYTWFYKDSLIQECRYYQGEFPWLRSFWKYNYNEDSKLTKVTKFNGDTAVEYTSSYAYTDFGKVSQVQTTIVGKKMNFLLMEYDERNNLSEKVFFKSLKKVPREIYNTVNGVFVRKKSSDKEKVKLRAKRWVYDYNDEGLLLKTTEISKTGDPIKAQLHIFEAEENKQSNLYDYWVEYDDVVRYIYNDLGQVAELYIIEVPENRVKKSYTFEYDDRGNVLYCKYLNYRKQWNIRLDFENEYVN